MEEYFLILYGGVCIIYIPNKLRAISDNLSEPYLRTGYIDCTEKLQPKRRVRTTNKKKSTSITDNVLQPMPMRVNTALSVSFPLQFPSN